jgi:hypothetical protein
MVRALAADVPGASIPFGAAHRMNFDTPSLVGRCGALRALVVYRLNLCDLEISSALRRWGVFEFQALIGDEMTTTEMNLHAKNGASGLRSKTASTKVTDTEFDELESFARGQGQSISEWIRQTLLTEARGQRSSAMNMHIFTELVGIQMLLMNTLEPLLRGEKMVPDQLAILFRQVQTSKAAKAQELLSRRSHNKEK